MVELVVVAELGGSGACGWDFQRLDFFLECKVLIYSLMMLIMISLMIIMITL